MKLYHGLGSSHSASVSVALAEKGLVYETCDIDLARFGQHDSAFLRLSPKGQVPLLEDDGRLLSEAFFILLYLDECFPTPALGGANARDRYDIQKWGKYVETHIAPNIAIVGWAQRGTKPGPDIQRNFDRLPSERRLLWQKASKGFDNSEVAAARSAVEKALGRVADTLAANAWLAGEGYSLADIIVFPHVARAEVLGFPIPVTLTDWLARIRARPHVAKVLSEEVLDQHIPTMGPEKGRWG